MSWRPTDEDWELAHQAYQEVHDRAIEDNRRFTRADVADRIAELRREARDARRWKARALAAEAELARLAATPSPERSDT